MYVDLRTVTGIPKLSDIHLRALKSCSVRRGPISLETKDFRAAFIPMRASHSSIPCALPSPGSYYGGFSASQISIALSLSSAHSSSSVFYGSYPSYSACDGSSQLFPGDLTDGTNYCCDFGTIPRITQSAP